MSSLLSAPSSLFRFASISIRKDGPRSGEMEREKKRDMYTHSKKDRYRSLLTAETIGIYIEIILRSMCILYTNFGLFVLAGHMRK